MASIRKNLGKAAVGLTMAGTVMAAGTVSAHASTVLFDKGVLPQYVSNFSTICRNLGGHFSTYNLPGPFIDVRCTR